MNNSAHVATIAFSKLFTTVSLSLDLNIISGYLLQKEIAYVLYENVSHRLNMKG